jgi:hypothetical protein
MILPIALAASALAILSDDSDDVDFFDLMRRALAFNNPELFTDVLLRYDQETATRVFRQLAAWVNDVDTLEAMAPRAVALMDFLASYTRQMVLDSYEAFELPHWRFLEATESHLGFKSHPSVPEATEIKTFGGSIPHLLTRGQWINRDKELAIKSAMQDKGQFPEVALYWIFVAGPAELFSWDKDRVLLICRKSMDLPMDSPVDPNDEHSDRRHKSVILSRHLDPRDSDMNTMVQAVELEKRMQ